MSIIKHGKASGTDSWMTRDGYALCSDMTLFYLPMKMLSKDLNYIIFINLSTVIKVIDIDVLVKKN